jgi:hypothetical protein
MRLHSDEVFLVSVRTVVIHAVRLSLYVMGERYVRNIVKQGAKPDENAFRIADVDGGVSLVASIMDCVLRQIVH